MEHSSNIEFKENKSKDVQTQTSLRRCPIQNQTSKLIGGPWKIEWSVLKSEVTRRWNLNTFSDSFFAFFSLCISFNDIISDVLVAESFLNGTDYIKDVKSQGYSYKDGR